MFPLKILLLVCHPEYEIAEALSRSARQAWRLRQFVCACGLLLTSIPVTHYMVLHGAAHLTRPLALSAVHRGVAFEERSMRLLQDHFSMSLRRVGGKADGGIDLQGWWWLPTDSTTSTHSTQQHRRLRVLAQCKAEVKKASPKYVREMEGVLHVAGTSHMEEGAYPTVGLLISSSSFSKLALLRAHASPLPFMLLHLPEHDTEDHNVQDGTGCAIGSVVFNPALGGPNGILKGRFEPRWEYAGLGAGGGRLGLWWDGRRVESWSPGQTT